MMTQLYRLLSSNIDRFCRKYIYSINNTDTHKNSLFHAIMNGYDCNAIEYLLDKGAIFNKFRDIKYNALLVAIRVGNIDIVKLLVRRGARTSVWDEKFPMLPLGSGYDYVFSRCVSRFDKQKEQYYMHFSASHLITAIRLNRIDIAKYLMETGSYEYGITSELIWWNAIYYSNSNDTIKFALNDPYELDICDYNLVWKIKDITSIQYIFNMLIDFHRFDIITEILCHFPHDGDTIYEHFFTETGVLTDIVKRTYVFQFDHIHKLVHLMTNKEKIPHFSKHYFDIQIITQ